MKKQCVLCSKDLKKHEVCNKEGSEGICDFCFNTVSQLYSGIRERNMDRDGMYFVLGIDPVLYGEAKYFCKKSWDKHNKLKNSPKVHDITQGRGKIRTQAQVIRSKKTSNKGHKKFKPAEIREILDAKIIGNENLKRDLSVMISKNTSGLFKGNFAALIMGESGSGKTESCRVLAEGMGAPFVSVSIKDIVPNGYKGRSIEAIFQDLLNKAQGSKTLAEMGFIHLDEIDKLFTAPDDDTLSKLLSDTLLGLMSGVEITCGETVIDTSRITFILSGAFSGLDKIVNKSNGVIGLADFKPRSKKVNFDYSQVTRDHLREYGLSNELIGRCTTITYTNKVTTEAMIDFMNMKDGILENYKKYFKEFGVDVVFNQDLLEAIAQKSIKKGVGMRGVEAELSEITSGYLECIDLFEGQRLEICLKDDRVKPQEEVACQFSA